MFKAEWNFEMTDDLYYFFHVVHYIFFYMKQVSW